MSKYSLCIIDDKIPAMAGGFDDTIKLNPSNLHRLLDNEANWDEKEIMDLMKKSLAEKQTWIVNAFTNPSFYINCFEEEFYRPDIIIFDWDYPGLDKPAEDYLLEILKKSFTVVRVYTRVDQDGDVKKAIESGSFDKFRNRVDILHKEDTDSVKKLIKEIDSLKNKNFSLKFGAELRNKIMGTVDDILVELGKISTDDVVWLFGEEDKVDNKRKLSIKELVEIVVNKLRNDLNSYQLGLSLPEIPISPSRSIDNDTVIKLWTFRLYYKPSDNLVRKGDIIKRKSSTDSRLYLVLSSDCHLCKFWKKNMGLLTLVPLHCVESNNSPLQTRLKLYQSEGKYKGKIIKPTSLTNTTGFEGPTVLPILQIDDNQYIDYVLFPKEILCAEIPPPSKDRFDQIKNNYPLYYKDMDEFDGDSRICISEPFLTPLIQHILYNITGYGVPDYPKELTDILEKRFAEMFPA